MIYVIDDDPVMRECIKRACGGAEVIGFSNAIDAMAEIENSGVPDLIFLDILLTGPDGFTFLNELVSYDDTAKIPIVVVSSLELEQYNLAEYGVVGILNKEKMEPREILSYVREYCK